MRLFGGGSYVWGNLRFHMAWPTVPEWAIDLLAGSGDGDRDGRAIVAVAGTEIVALACT
jgi:hypothetical protein